MVELFNYNAFFVVICYIIGYYLLQLWTHNYLFICYKLYIFDSIN